VGPPILNLSQRRKGAKQINKITFAGFASLREINPREIDGR